MKAALNSITGLNNIYQSEHDVDTGFLNEPTIGFYYCNKVCPFTSSTATQMICIRKLAEM
jgi:hypothetical protein